MTDLRSSELYPTIAKRPLPSGAFQITVPVDIKGLEVEDFLPFGLELPFSLRSAVKKRQIEYLSGRFCARLAMEELGIAVPREVGLAEDRSPIWDADLIGSITHTEGWASAAVCRKDSVLGLGLDLEHEMAAASVQMRKHICVDEAELEAVCAELGCERERGLTLIFSSKESLFKATYARVQRFFGFHAARLRAQGPEIRIELVGDLNDTLREGLSWPVSYRQLPGSLIETLIIEPRADN